MRFLDPEEFAPNPFHKASNIAHHVPIATVRDNLYVLTDYSFASVFRVQGMLYDLSTAQDTVEYVETLKGVLNTLLPGVQIKFLHRITHNYRDWLEEHLSIIDGSNPFARYVAWDQARHYNAMMEKKQLLRSDNLIVLTYKVPDNWYKEGLSITGMMEALVGLVDKPSSVQKPLQKYESIIQKYEDVIRPVVQQMQMAGLQPQRLTNDELYNLAWETLNPRKSLRHPCPKISIPDARDPAAGILKTTDAKRAVVKRREFTIVAPDTERSQLCHSDWRITPGAVEVDGGYYAAISLRMLPERVFPSMAIRLAALPFETTVSIDCVMLNKHKELEKQWAEARSAASKAEAVLFGGTPDPAEREKAQELKDRYLKLTAGSENPFRMRMTVVISGDTRKELDQRCDSVVSLLRDMENAVGNRERYGVHLLLKAAWPFGLITDINSRKTITSQIAYMLPVFSRWEGSKRPVTLVLDRLNRLVRLDPFPKNQLNKNRTICGASGSGKSFLTQLALVQPHAARANTEILIIESGGSFELTTMCFGGVNIRLGPKSKERINAFDLPTHFDDLAPEAQEQELSYKYDFITKLILCMVDLEGKEEIKLAENVIGAVCQRTYASVRAPRLGDFYRVLGQYRNPDDTQAEATAKRVRTLLVNYVVQENGEAGIYAPYFDVETNFKVEDAPIITFDLIDVKNTPGLLIPLTMVTLMGLIYNRIMSRDGKDRLVIVDEAWALIKERPDGSQSPAGQAIELFWREGRKMGSSSTMISQNYSDMTNDKVGRAIVGNSPIQFFLVHERIPDNDNAFRAANFTPEKISTVYGLKTQYGKYSEVLIKEGSDWGVVRLPSPGLRYWLATTDPEDLKLLRRYKATFADGYGLPIHLVVAILSEDYPMGAHGAQGADNEMPEIEALQFAERFQARLNRFQALQESGATVPFDFE
jgi:type IV secretory pathway VirB4 component